MTEAVIVALIGGIAMIVVEWIRRGPAAKLLAAVERVDRKVDALAKFQGLDFQQDRDRVLILRKSILAAAEYQDEAAKP